MHWPLSEPFEILVALLVIEGLILHAGEHPRMRWFFKYLPSMFWIYFLPMLASSAGLIVSDSPAYDAIRTYVLPACLVLLLLGVDVGAILKLGPVALGVMLAGSLGTMVGAVVSLGIFRHHLPADMWMGFGCLSASWIGGSANMIAVKEAMNAPDGVYLPMVVVDTIVPYAWMGMLILVSSRQAWYDRHNRSRMELIGELAGRARADGAQAQPLASGKLGLMLAAGGAVALLSLWGADLIARGGASLGPGWGAIKGMLTINKAAWPILLASAGGIALSFTPLRRLEGAGASKVGFFLLYLVLASIGARTNVAHLMGAPLLLAAGAAWIAIHGLFVVGAGRLLRAPMGLIAAASQANIGGPASAPVVAGIYQPSLAPVGLLLAILGNIIGTYLGLACSYLCKLVAGA